MLLPLKRMGVVAGAGVHSRRLFHAHSPVKEGSLKYLADEVSGLTRRVSNSVIYLNVTLTCLVGAIVLFPYEAIKMHGELKALKARQKNNCKELEAVRAELRLARLKSDLTPATTTAPPATTTATGSSSPADAA